MKSKFSKKWEASKQPRKQRKFRANAPLHIRKKFLSVNLSKELRKKYGKRNVVVRKGDKVKIQVGKFKKQEGKIIRVFTKLSKVYIDSVQAKKQDGSKVNVKIQPSNLQIIELNLEDKKRFKSKTEEKVKVTKSPTDSAKTLVDETTKKKNKEEKVEKKLRVKKEKTK